MKYEVIKNREKSVCEHKVQRKKLKKQKSKAEKIAGKKAIRQFKDNKEIPIIFKTPRKGWAD